MKFNRLALLASSYDHTFFRRIHWRAQATAGVPRFAAQLSGKCDVLGAETTCGARTAARGCLALVAVAGPLYFSGGVRALFGCCLQSWPTAHGAKQKHKADAVSW